jgi:hypothetical protein
MVRKVPLCCVMVLSTFCSLSCRTTAVATGDQEQTWLTRGYRYDENGWIFLHTEGGPFERGFQRGYLTANEIDEFLRTVAYVEEFQTGRDLDYFVRAAARLFRGKVPAEYVAEMRGIAAGMTRAGKPATYEQGRIVMAHNSWVGYALGKSANIILEIAPQQGHRVLMQSWGPCLYSATDFFLTDAGLIGTETTIGGFNGFDRRGTPVFVRARQAMQYADSIDEWSDILICRNSGAYANSWLLGDINTGEIACLELGLKHHSLEKKKNGYFTGSNVTRNVQILRRETGATWDDVRDGCVARRVRWEQLMKGNYGRINVPLAQQMLADHYDVYLQKEQPGSRTICGHGERDDGGVPGSGPAYRPSGAFDGKVIDSDLAKNWRLWARWGRSCDLGFTATEFLQQHPQYDWMKGYLPDLPPRPWTLFPRQGAGRQ